MWGPRQAPTAVAGPTERPWPAQLLFPRQAVGKAGNMFVILRSSLASAISKMDRVGIEPTTLGLRVAPGRFRSTRRARCSLGFAGTFSIVETTTLRGRHDFVFPLCSHSQRLARWVIERLAVAANKRT